MNLDLMVGWCSRVGFNVPTAGLVRMIMFSSKMWFSVYLVERDDKTQLVFTGKNVNEMMKLRPLICYCDIFSEKKKQHISANKNVIWRKQDKRFALTWGTLNSYNLP